MVPSKSPSDVPSTSPSDVPPTSPSDVPSESLSDVPSTSPLDVPSTGPSDAEPFTCTSLSASAASSTSTKSGHIDSDGLHDADIPNDFFISPDPEFRKAWSRFDKKSRISIPHCKAGTGKKNRELQVPHHELLVLQDRFYNASDVPSTSPSDVPSTSLSDVTPTNPSDVTPTSPSDVPSTSPSDVPSTSPSDVPSKSPLGVPSTSPSDLPPTSPSDLPPTSPSDALPWGPFCVYFRDDGEHSNPDVPKILFISCNPEFRQSWSRLDKKTRISNLHCKAGTGKKNHELQVRHHKLQVLQD
jgi:hypothetical protein